MMDRLAWHIEAFARQKVLPNIKRVLGIPERAQTDEEMAAAISQWVTIHNANERAKAARGES